MHRVKIEGNPLILEQKIKQCLEVATFVAAVDSLLLVEFENYGRL